jgi:spore coat protein H
MKILRVHCIMMTAALSVVPLYGCSGSEANSGTGGSGGTGGGGGAEEIKEEPDYARAFPQDRVPRLDVTIPQANWQAMVDDMTGLLGAFGVGGMGGPGGPGGPGGGMMPPQEIFDACDGLAAGDACKVSLMGMEVSGKCSDLQGALACFPSGGPGGGPGGPGGEVGGGIDLIGGTPIYVECDVATEDRSWHHVGIRFKGNSSLGMPWRQGIWKLPLRLTFDKFDDTYPETKVQRFYGFKALGLSNGSADQSLLREKLGTDVFGNAGIPAPATAFYRIFIDHGDGPTYFGLYTGIELPSDDAFLDTHFDSHKGNLYKPDGAGAQWATWNADSLGKENHEDEADFSDAQALFDALHADRTDASAWRAGLESRLDVSGFLHWLALNTVIQDWDTYGRMAHNYYLYADPGKGGQFQWIPWDHSFAFASGMGAMSLSMAEVTDQWPLIRYLLDDPEYLKVYQGYVAQAAEKEYAPAAAEARFQAAHDLIKPYVVGPEGEIKGYTFLSSDTAFDDALAALIAHTKQRQGDVAAYLTP